MEERQPLITESYPQGNTALPAYHAADEFDDGSFSKLYRMAFPKKYSVTNPVFVNKSDAFWRLFSSTSETQLRPEIRTSDFCRILLDHPRNCIIDRLQSRKR